jgi:hypothetical protein
MKKWSISHDSSYNLESWVVTDGYRIFEVEDEEEAEFLCDSLNGRHLLELIDIWRNRASSFRTFAEEYSFEKEKEGISPEIFLFNETAEKHMDACCRMIEICVKELKKKLE